MRYVKLGAIQTVLIIGVMALAAAGDGGYRRAMWPLAGGGLVGGMMWFMYSSALARGRDAQPGMPAWRAGGGGM